jgi:hypothetical protein
MAQITAHDTLRSATLHEPITVGQRSEDPGNYWHQFFGPPRGEITTNPYDKYQYET